MKCLSNHEQGADLLVGYLEGTLDAGQAAELDQHAAACTECRELLAVQAYLDEAGLEDEAVPEVSAGFDARLYARIDQEKQARTSQWWRGEFWSKSLGGAWLRPAVASAVAAVVLAIGFVVSTPEAGPPAAVNASIENGGGVEPDQGKVAQVNVDVEIEQLEQALDDLELLMPIG